MRHRWGIIVAMSTLLSAHSGAAPLDINALWDFAQPAVSEQRFRDALASAQGDDALILQTQIARSHGLRRNFIQAREILASIESALPSAGPTARVRHALELGRTHASATHHKDELTPAAVDAARNAYQRALDIAQQHQLDGLAIDAIHMFAFVDRSPADQLRWGQRALAVAQASKQPEATRWQASIHNNVGYALHQLGRYPEALVHFEEALKRRESMGNATNTRTAHWMIAWTLRALKQNAKALLIQERLERENDAAGTPDAYVFEELEVLHREAGDVVKAKHYQDKLQAAKKSSP